MRFTHHAPDYLGSRRFAPAFSPCAPVFPKDSKNARRYAALSYEGFEARVNGEVIDERSSRIRPQRGAGLGEITRQIAQPAKLVGNRFRYLSPSPLRNRKDPPWFR
jgi:hypothetical protein